MFRVLVIVAAAALPVILAGALVGPLAGLLVLLAEAGVAIGHVWQRRRHAQRQRAERERRG